MDFGLNVRSDGKRCGDMRTVKKGWAQADTYCGPSEYASEETKLAYRNFVRMHVLGYTCQKHCKKVSETNGEQFGVPHQVSADGKRCEPEYLPRELEQLISDHLN